MENRTMRLCPHCKQMVEVNLHVVRPGRLDPQKLLPYLCDCLGLCIINPLNFDLSKPTKEQMDWINAQPGLVQFFDSLKEGISRIKKSRKARFN